MIALWNKSTEREETHIESPVETLDVRVRIDVAFEIHIVAFFDLRSVQAATQGDLQFRSVCGSKEKKAKGTPIPEWIRASLDVRST